MAGPPPGEAVVVAGVTPLVADAPPSQAIERCWRWLAGGGARANFRVVLAGCWALGIGGLFGEANSGPPSWRGGASISFNGWKGLLRLRRSSGVGG